LLLGRAGTHNIYYLIVGPTNASIEMLLNGTTERAEDRAVRRVQPQENDTGKSKKPTRQKA